MNINKNNACTHCTEREIPTCFNILNSKCQSVNLVKDLVYIFDILIMKFQLIFLIFRHGNEYFKNKIKLMSTCN